MLLAEVDERESTTRKSSAARSNPKAAFKTPIGSSLHPSWEASRRKKEKETKLTSFQGHRTVFSDSD